jgi:hypothetical protein
MKRLTGNPFRMKQLTLAQARECETAQKPKCVCRCRGAFHGANRFELNMEKDEDSRKLDRTRFVLLAFDDPHRLLPEDEEKAYAKARKTIRQRHLYHGTWVDQSGVRTYSGHGTWVRPETIPDINTREYVGYGEAAVVAEYAGPCPLCMVDDEKGGAEA